MTRMVPSADRSPVSTLPESSVILIDLQGGMEAEADHLGVFRCGEGDGGLCLEMMSGGVDLGVDDVAGDVERGAFRPLCGERRIPR